MKRIFVTILALALFAGAAQADSPVEEGVSLELAQHRKATISDLAYHLYFRIPKDKEQSVTGFFLSRPRRFGKSLILSTIEAYFEGQKDLFDGLAIADIEKEWNAYTVIHIDINTGLYNSVENLKDQLDFILSQQEEKHGLSQQGNLPSQRLESMIKRLSKQAGRNVVVLIDEYDKPLLEAIGKPELQEAMRDELRSFYSVLKSCDQYIRFAMLTGVTKFGRLSVFSGLNNLEDISFDSEYASICGITEQELLNTFGEGIEGLTEDYECSTEEMVDMLRNKYDGYRFTNSKTLVYNPFSLLIAFKRKTLGDYWFETGTPNYLVELLRRNHYTLSNLDGATATVSQLSAFNPDTGDDPIPVMYQSGYLTIKDYDKKRNFITLGFPNEEVRAGFMEYIYPFYAKVTRGQKIPFLCFKEEIEDGKAEAFMKRLQAMTADMS
ncbi:MAG: AAA family ATPase, partial [Muribaculaceae bacterium]|nr:AAA family ATPase [Muribaculaceae bacterium]